MIPLKEILLRLKVKVHLKGQLKGDIGLEGGLARDSFLTGQQKLVDKHCMQPCGLYQLSAG